MTHPAVATVPAMTANRPHSPASVSSGPPAPVSGVSTTVSAVGVGCHIGRSRSWREIRMP